MTDHDVAHTSTTEGLPVSPSLAPSLEAAHIPPQTSAVDSRVVLVCALSAVIAIVAAFAALALTHLIAFITNISFFGRFSDQPSSPADNHFGLFVIAIPVIGGVIVGLMAKLGSKAIRGHGIPEAMEQVLTNQSRIPARLTWLKPISAAISIGTGGPFGAEGPIIATGGAFGSLVGQIVWVSAAERKTLLAAGAAAGMAATFGTPLSALLLAVELLLFEFRARSLIPVALAAAIAACVRLMMFGPQPIFAIAGAGPTTAAPLIAYLIIGAILGAASVGITKIIYLIEDAFERLPLHWMWWPALGGVAVGVIGCFSPRTLGVGYDNITDIVNTNLSLQAVALLCLFKFMSWSIALGSGTSGGTLAPILTVGGGMGVLLGAAVNAIVPWAAVDVRVAGLVGMAALFGGASRAVFASAVFALETTLQPYILLPVLAGCTSSFLISALLMRHTIMTEKIVRRGVRVPADYSADVLEQALVSDVATKDVVTLYADQSVASACAQVRPATAGMTHHGFPVVNDSGALVGVITRPELLDVQTPANETLTVRQLLRRPPVLVYGDCVLREAVDHMVRHNVGRLPVVDRDDPRRLIGIITRSDILSAYRAALDQHEQAPPVFRRRKEKPGSEPPSMP